MEHKTAARLVIQSCDNDLPGVFGHGRVLLLQGIAREHSLNRAGKRAVAVYKGLHAEITHAIATKATDLIASIKE